MQWHNIVHRDERSPTIINWTRTHYWGKACNSSGSRTQKLR